ncbi:LamG domain-containing protein [Actinoplanes sp. NPDC051861]|uniref:LamG domain-containing protein n=1 Tax=Actinoplanes sp. NPDC051861 TaxID=3155170 RepID=UPI00343867C2
MAVTVAMALGAAVPGSPVSAAPAVPSVEATADAAMAAALRSGKRVEALAERTEFSQTFAEPTGRLTYEASAVPQWVRRSGKWVDIDPTLARKDGVLRPAATLADVRFSAGGDGPLMTLVRAGRKLTMSWPLGRLPKPKVSGDSATYAGVLPDVDLVMRATRTGFTHVLVVKTAEAAANPAIREIRFDLGGDAVTQRLPDGSLQAVAGGRLLATASVPQMWDSSVPAGETASEVRSSHRLPGDAAKIAKLGTEVTAGGDLRLRPDPSLLGPKAKFPVYIDPDWSTGKSRWAYATDNNSNNTDTSVARVGSDPNSGKVYRSFIEFPTTAIRYKHVADARVRMELTHSASCDGTPTSMFVGGSITTPRTAWGTSVGKHLTTVSSHANEGDGCDDSPQPDATVNFIGGVTALIGQRAEKGMASVTFAFRAGAADGAGEGDWKRWKKFLPNEAKLIADVDFKPTKPERLQVNGVACTAAGISIGVTNPYFSADVRDQDGNTQNLRATWSLYRVATNGALTQITGPAATSATANTRSQTARVTGLVTNTRYAFRVFATDPYDIDSPLSDYCYFTVDTTKPDVVVTPVALPVGPGKPGTFTFSSTYSDVTKFQYGWTEGYTSTVTAATVSGKTGKHATVTLTAPKFGITVLYVKAVDATANAGYGSLQFEVARPSPPLARWLLETTPVEDEAGALMDRQAALAGDNALTVSGAAWADKGRVIDAKNLTFTGANNVTTPAFLDTTKSYSVAAWVRLDSLTGAQTFVSQDGANVANFQLQYRADDVTGDGVAEKSWCFGLRNTDTAATGAYTYACAAGLAVAGRWTHLAGVYDETTKRISLWVDAGLKAEVTAPTAWKANGPFRIGSRKYTGSQWLDYVVGSVTDVQAFDRVLVLNDFSGKMASEPDSGGVDEPGIVAPVQVGGWDFETILPCPQAGDAERCQALDLGTGWNRRFALTEGTTSGPGNRSQGLAVDTTHFTEDPADPNYGKTTIEYGTSERNVALAGEPQQWVSGPLLRTEQSFAVSVWVQPRQLAGTMTALAQRGTFVSPFYVGIRQSTVNGVTGPRFQVMTVNADRTENEVYSHLIAPALLTADDLDEWYHLVFVYVAHSTVQMRLYVNGAVAATGPGVLWSAPGSLSVGRGWWSADAGNGAYYDQWVGGIDDVAVYQGHLTSGQVNEITSEQSPL